MSFIAVGIMVAATATTAAISASQANKAKKQAEKYSQQLSKLESTRQEIINPYESVKDLSSTITNPYANLQVATQAAEMQATQTDISLANTLDTIRATGGGAGGATALAREAALSKQQISATIESQEVQNNQLRAQGEMQRQQSVMGEKTRVQSAQAAGSQFMFGAREDREIMGLNRTAALQQNQEALRSQYRQQTINSISSGAGDLASFSAGFQSE